MTTESLGQQSRFVQQIALEVLQVDGYKRCLDDRSIICLTATKFESFIFSVMCLTLENGANSIYIKITLVSLLFDERNAPVLSRYGCSAVPWIRKS